MTDTPSHSKRLSRQEPQRSRQRNAPSDAQSGRQRTERHEQGQRKSQRQARHDDPLWDVDDPTRDKRPSANAYERGARRQAQKARRLRLPSDEAPQRIASRGRGFEVGQSFKCGHCKRFVGPLPSGGHHRNHCPFCLYSRHVDDRRSGDRASACGSLMEPIGAFQRPNGEHVVVHRCRGCGFERFNRIAADDDFDFVLSLPVVPPRSARSEETTNGENNSIGVINKPVTMPGIE